MSEIASVPGRAYERCPFCMSPSIEIVEFHVEAGGGFQLRCNSCEARGPVGVTRDAAMFKWNQRPALVLLRKEHLMDMGTMTAITAARIREIERISNDRLAKNVALETRARAAEQDAKDCRLTLEATAKLAEKATLKMDEALEQLNVMIGDAEGDQDVR